jgi:hypothetical protein
MRIWAFGATSASTTIRLFLESHQPPAESSIASKDTLNPSDSVNARNGAMKWRCESPVSGSHGGPSGAGSAPSTGATCARSKTKTVLNSVIVSPVSSPLARSRSLTGIGDRDRALALLDRIPEPQPAPKAGDERRVRSGERDEQLVRERQTRQPGLRPHSHPPLPALRGQQLLGRALQPLAIPLAALGTLGVRQPTPGPGHDGSFRSGPPAAGLRRPNRTRTGCDNQKAGPRGHRTLRPTTAAGATARRP